MEKSKEATLEARVAVLEQQVSRLGDFSMALMVLLRAVALETGPLPDSLDHMEFNLGEHLFSNPDKYRTGIAHALLAAHIRWFSDCSDVVVDAVKAGADPKSALDKKFWEHNALSWPAYMEMLSKSGL